jgi:hypothetical protein
MHKVCILKTPNADTRSMKVLDKKLVELDTRRHINAVKIVNSALVQMMNEQFNNHDYTKTKHFDLFFADLSTKKTGKEFKELEWWKKHLQERHHLNDHCPDDVNLIDVLEMAVDCVCAGKARTGNVFPIELSNEILQKALANTVEMLKLNIVTIGDD